MSYKPKSKNCLAFVLYAVTELCKWKGEPSGTRYLFWFWGYRTAKVQKTSDKKPIKLNILVSYDVWTGKYLLWLIFNTAVWNQIQQKFLKWKVKRSYIWQWKYSARLLYFLGLNLESTFLSYVWLTWRRNLLPQRHWYPYIKLQGTMSQKTVLIDITKSQLSKIFKCRKCALRCKTLFHSFTFV